MKYLFTSLFIFLSIFCNAQYKIISLDTNINTPKVLISDTTKDTLGFIITYKQALKIDKDEQLIKLYKSAHTDCDSVITYLNESISNYKDINALYAKKINVLDTMLNINRIELFDVNKQLELCEDKCNLKDSIIKDENKIISLDKKDIRKYKTERNVIAVTSIIAFIYILIHFIH
jgi:hypothetical protein